MEKQLQLFLLKLLDIYANSYFYIIREMKLQQRFDLVTKYHDNYSILNISLYFKYNFTLC